MKDYDFDKHEKRIRTAARHDLFLILCCVIIMMGVGCLCYLASSALMVKINEKMLIEDRVFNYFYEPDWNAEEEDKLLSDFAILFFMSISIIAVFFYGLCLKLLKYIKKIQIFYNDFKEQINEMLTATIFFLGFIPVILNFIFTENQTDILNEIDSFYVVYLMGLVSPYIYSMISKIYDINIQKNTSKSYIEHLKMKVNK